MNLALRLLVTCLQTLIGWLGLLKLFFKICEFGFKLAVSGLGLGDGGCTFFNRTREGCKARLSDCHLIRKHGKFGVMLGQLSVSLSGLSVILVELGFGVVLRRLNALKFLSKVGHSLGQFGNLKHCLFGIHAQFFNIDGRLARGYLIAEQRNLLVGHAQ